MNRSLAWKWVLIGLLAWMALAPALADDERFKVRVFGARVTSGADQADQQFEDPLFTAAVPYTLTAEDGSPIPIVADQGVLGYQVDPGAGNAFGISAEYRIIDLIGVEAGWVSGTIDNSFATVLEQSDPIVVPGLPAPVIIPASVQTAGFDTDFDQAYVAVNVHLIDRGKPVDVYFGPVFGTVDVGDAAATIPGGEIIRIVGDDGSGLGLQVGVDVQIRDSAWFVTTGLRYVDADVTLTFEGDAPVFFPQVDADVDPFTFVLGGGYRF